MPVGKRCGKPLHNAAIVARNGKVLRRVARASYVQAPQGDLTSLEDASVLDRWPTAGAGAAPVR